MTSYDTVILGSSASALAATAYLARAGQRVLLLEPSAQIGGAMTTDEFADGFRADLGLYSGRIDPGIARDLRLHDHGLEAIERDTITSLLPERRSFTLPADREAAADVIRGFAPNDAARYGQFMRLLDLASDLLRSAYATTPPEAHHPSAADAARLMALAGQLRGYGRREMAEVTRLLVMSARDLLDEWFESAELKGLLASAAVRGLTQGPFAGGTTFNLLHHLAIGDGYVRATAKGGIGAIGQALASAAQSHGAELRANAGAARAVVSDGVATGVQLESGEVIAATRVISDYDARQTFTRLVGSPELEPEFNRAVRNIRYNGAVARVNLALRELPGFAGVAEEALGGTLTIAPSLAYLEKAFDGAKYGDISEQPYIEASLPTLADATLAPAGKHVLSVWLQYAPYRNKLDPERVRELAIARLSEYAPDLPSLVLHSQVVMPRDFEERFGMSEGHLYGGDMTLAQAFFLRPLPGFAQYRTPIEQLYLCGAATHPGGGVSGLAGRNAANELLSDRSFDDRR
ncbi:MAG TPA: NAD(P)/FAD-dependent oxidoreductase [Roseiflexaceae bacterium]|nr:NAD(P)/FAD-dependent oxidoreductase [Roseiflexaceae bacterium]